MMPCKRSTLKQISPVKTHNGAINKQPHEIMTSSFLKKSMKGVYKTNVPVCNIINHDNIITLILENEPSPITNIPAPNAF